MPTSIPDILQAGPCSGCGACVLAGAATRMTLDREGDLRPITNPAPAPDAPALDTYCPAILVERPSVPGAEVDADFGPWLGAWVAHATDDELRFQGSSGGVLSALNAYALSLRTGVAVAVRGGAGTRSEGTVVIEIADVEVTASSRYAPVSSLATAAGLDAFGFGDTVTCRPCEASALHLLAPNEASRPLVLSFFCAGVPSQWATDRLVNELGGDASDVSELRYRGRGWPGRFSVTDKAGRAWSASYEESWGEHLGRQIQDRCKICVDGVGESADISAADLWETDDRGYPVFEDAPGRSLVIARTPRGLDIMRSAITAGALVAEQTDLELARTVQQLHVTRRRLLLGRLAGRWVAKGHIPRYRGFGLTKSALARPIDTLRQARGTFARTRQKRKSTAQKP